MDSPQITCVNCGHIAQVSNSLLSELGRLPEEGEVICCVLCMHPMTIIPDGLRISTKQEVIDMCSKCGKAPNPEFLANAT